MRIHSWELNRRYAVIASLPIIVALSASCGGGPHLVDVFDRDDIKERPACHAMLRAPIAVVGRVLSVHQIGGVRSSSSTPAIKVELVRVRVAVENVLKGRVTHPEIDFFYFRYSAYTRIDIGVFAYQPQRGDHRVFFLREENGIFRAVKDVTDYTLQVHSGSHQGTAPPPGSSLREGVGWVLLTPGRGMKDAVFAEYLNTAFHDAVLMSSDTYALNLLNPLLKSDSAAIRTEAESIVASVKACACRLHSAD
jgi:hypothetical protein